MRALILIVDDSAEDREAARLNLSEAAEADGTGFRFIECGTGAAGLLACRSEAPDCILLDHRLPDMDGLEFLENLKQGAQALPVAVVMVTGLAGISLASHALRAGAQEYVPKQSLQPAMLYRAVQSARNRFNLLERHEITGIWEALALSRAETQEGVAALLASTLALASSQEETTDGLARLRIAAAALSESQAETELGLNGLVVSAEALSVSQQETRDGRADLLASSVVNRALRLANAALVASDAALRESQARLHEVLCSRQIELERLVAERTLALLEAEARFHEIFDSQLQFITVLAPDGTIIEMNQTALDAAALDRCEVIGLAFRDIGWWLPDQRPRVQQDIAAAAAGGVVRREVEIRPRSDEERHIWIDLSLKAVRDPVTGAVIWLIAESHDVTEKRRLTQQLVQAQKMQALGQLAAGIAHDFNNILQVVSGSAALIEQRPDDLDRTRRLARSAMAASVRGMSITQRLLSFGRRAELRVETIATAELLNGICEVLRPSLGTTIAVSADVAPGVPPMLADRTQLEICLINLGNNARDAMPGGGTLMFAARPEHIAEGLHHPAGLAAGDYIRLTVSDNGIGMDAATLARVSEPFFTTKPRGKGTGLGVAMAKGFAEQSGGRLSIDSTLGLGTRITLWLHQATAIVAPSRGAESALHDGPVPTACVLLVDDDDAVREVLATGLEAAGFRTLLASSGQEAIALLEVGEAVDVLVSDFSMPAMNGVTVIERARAMRPTLPCFLLTGYVGDGALSSIGKNFVLRKPISGRALSTAIEAALLANRIPSVSGA